MRGVTVFGKPLRELKDQGPQWVALNHRQQAMKLLADQPGALFIGQGVAADGVAGYDDLERVPMEQRIEFPVAEELNVGAAIGLSLQGFLPIVCIPRMDFLLRAMDQLVNHLDKLELMGRGQFKPKVIIRTRVGSRTPLDAGPQHTGDYTSAFRSMLTSVEVERVSNAASLVPAYQRAIDRPGSTLIVEAL